MRIDAHQHFWRVARGDYHWMATGEALAPLRRDFLPADFDTYRRRFGIDRTVLVQAAATVAETDFMLALAEETPLIAKVVGWIDFEQANARADLERLARHPKFAGVRPMIQDLPDVDWMHRADVQWAFEAIVDLDLTFDGLGLPAHLDDFLRLFERYPSMRTVVDHGMKPAIRDRAFEPWARKLETIARSTAVCCKLSGLVTEAGAEWTPPAIAPYVRHIVDCFGADRVMWGSDWPVVNLAGGYERWWQAATALVPLAARDHVFGRTASRFYRIK